MDSHSATALGKSGTVTVRRDDRRWMELVFVGDAEFARRRIELLRRNAKISAPDSSTGSATFQGYPVDIPVRLFWRES
jgi:hypothetical protein